MRAQRVDHGAVVLLGECLGRRGVTLTGANSVNAPRELRQRAWDALAAELDLNQLDEMTTTIGLEDTIPYAERILAGRTRGRTVVDVNR